MVHSSLKVSHCEKDSAVQSTASALPFAFNLILPMIVILFWTAAHLVHLTSKPMQIIVYVDTSFFFFFFLCSLQWYLKGFKLME